MLQDGKHNDAPHWTKHAWFKFSRCTAHAYRKREEENIITSENKKMNNEWTNINKTSCSSPACTTNHKNNKEKAQAPKFNFEWINKGRIFKRIGPYKNHIIFGKNKESENKYEVLDFGDEITNNNNIIHSTAMGIESQDEKKQNNAMINEIKSLKEKN